MTHTLGGAGLLGAALITLLLAFRYRLVAYALAAAFLARLAAALVHFYITPLPDGITDAVSFERDAAEGAENGFVGALSHFPGMDSYFYAWLMALLYALTDQSLLLLQSTSVLAGVLGVCATYVLACGVWNNVVAGRAAWVMALFSTVVQYGALPMREAWFVLFFLLGAIAVVRWHHRRKPRYVVWATLSFVITGFFHGGAAVALFTFYGVLAGDAVRALYQGLKRYRVRVFAALAFGTVVALGVGCVASGISIPKLGTAIEMLRAERWMHYFEAYHRGAARYPDWPQPDHVYDLLWAVPLRAVYLLGSPFPWDVSTVQQALGLIDAVLYWLILIVLIRHWRAIWGNGAARLLLLPLIPMVIAFAIGVSNFGAAIRYRAKFVGLIIVAISPLIPWVRVWPTRLLSAMSSAPRHKQSPALRSG